MVFIIIVAIVISLTVFFFIKSKSIMKKVVISITVFISCLLLSYIITNHLVKKWYENRGIKIIQEK